MRAPYFEVLTCNNSTDPKISRDPIMFQYGVTINELKYSDEISNSPNFNIADISNKKHTIRVNTQPKLLNVKCFIRFINIKLPLISPQLFIFNRIFIDMNLGETCEFKINFPEADFWLIRKGSGSRVGEPTKTFSPENIGVRVDRESLEPSYAYYLFTYIHDQGFYKSRAKGTTNLKHISISDIKNIKFG